MNALDDPGQRLLDWLVEHLHAVTPGRYGTYVGYREVHQQLGLPLVGRTDGESLQPQGLDSLAKWTLATGKPAITGLIIHRNKERPGSGYYDLFDKDLGDTDWWDEEIRRAKAFDWTPFVSPSTRQKLVARTQSPPPPPLLPETPTASDLDEPPPRVGTKTLRIVRDTEIARWVKGLYNHICQLCRKPVPLDDETNYAEAHHIRPLGGDHRGLDEPGNILCVCPNCHARLDYGAIELRLADIKTAAGHIIDPANVNYHNKCLLRR